MKSNYINFLRKAFSKALQTQSMETQDVSRRKFLKTAYALTLGTIITPSVMAINKSVRKPTSKKRIAIIGAGIAGLSAAYFLQKQNIECSVFEASSRVGGRMFSIKDWAGKGMTTDLGAEFVCDYHKDLIDLAKELKVELYDLRNDPLFNTPPSFFIEGKERSFDDFVKGLQPAVQKINDDLRNIKFDFTYKNVSPRIAELDKLNILQYLQQFDLETWVQKMLAMIFEVEYGMDAEEQSCLNMLCVIKLPNDNEKMFEVLGKDYEAFKIKNGTQALAEAVYKKVKHQVFLKHALTQYDKNSSGKYELVFNGGAERNSIKTFDYLIITVPFLLLKKIKTNIEFPPHKQDAIDNMGYANNCKTILGFTKPAWRDNKKSGVFFSDLAIQCGWDSTAEQRTKTNTAASITFFYGGKKAEIFHDLSASDETKISHLMIQKLLGIDFGKYHNNKKTAMVWKNYPFAQCSYTSYKVGQWTKFAGVPQEAFENIFFAGEHCSISFQGFMNGAIQSAKEASKNILNKIQISS